MNHNSTKKVLITIGFLSLLFSCSNRTTKITEKNIKVGFVYNGSIHDEGYTQTHDAGRLELIKMGIPTLYVENVSDSGNESYDIINDLIDEGCNVIYATSYGFMDSVVKAADEHPDLIFNHCSGITTRKNLSTYYGKMFQARYLAGIVAGLKTKTNKLGYVAAYPFPECIRQLNAFTLGAKSINPDIEVFVAWTKTWYDPMKEKEGALKVFEQGCDVIEQHQDTIASQLAAQDAGAYCLGYNFPTPEAAPDSYLTAPIFRWEVFVTKNVKSILNGTWKSESYWQGLETGIVDLGELSSLCENGTEEKVLRAKNRIIYGDLKIFSGPLYDNNGNLKVKKGEYLSDDEIFKMDWLIKGITDVSEVSQ